MRILVVEDTKDMNLLIVKTLKKAGYSVDGCYNGEDAGVYLLGAEYDAIVLDIMMPKVDGYQLLHELRGKGSDIPILLLTAKDTIADRVKGLDLGADDYLLKPFDFEELLARIRAMTRKHVGRRNNQLTIADLVVNSQQRTVSRAGVNIPLIPKEFTILEYMIRNQEIVLSREQLENQIWNYEYSGSSNNIDVYMSRLRKKIDYGFDTKLIHTLRGIGWVMRKN